MFIYIFGSKIVFKKNLDCEHTLLLQLKNPKLNKKSNMKSSILVTFKNNIKRTKFNSVGRQSPPFSEITIPSNKECEPSAILN